ncbi:MAG: TIM barrel protein [Ruminococcus sp.]|jgi:deoxyribonuclease-4|nr:TIM barrel protein [Ruminococcus sp.]
MVRFGTAGVGDSFAELGYKKTAEVGEYLAGFGLNHFEYQCGQGVRLSEASGKVIGAGLAEKGVTVSLHAPYFISLSSVDEAKRTGSVRYILESAGAVTALGGTRIVIHSGSCAKMSREAALALALDTMKLAKTALVEHGFSDVICCPETMGKFNQLGTLDEVLTLCELDESFIPCIDFGHLNARTVGGIKTKADYAEIIDSVKNRLGEYRYKNFHSHFSKIMYTEKGGEKKHLTFGDNEYGPAFEPLIELIAERDLTPVIVCESDGTQAEDAAIMKKYLENLR